MVNVQRLAPPTLSDQLNFSPQFSQDWELLLACIRLYFDRPHEPRDRAALLSTVQQPEQWKSILNLAVQQGLTALLFHNLQTYGADWITPALTKEIQICGQSTRFRSTFLTFNLAKILDSLNANQVIALPYKGATLAQLAYGDLQLRRFNDLDILVQPQDLSETRRVLQTLGYSQASCLEWEESWVHPVLEINIDVHHSLVPRQLLPSLSYQHLKNNLIPIQFLASELKSIHLSSLDIESLFVSLSLLIVKDHISWSLKFCQLLDLAALLRNNPQIDWHKVLKFARQSGSVRIVLMQFVLLKQLFGIEPPLIFKDQILRDRTLSKLAQAILSRVTGSPKEHPQGIGFIWTLISLDHYFYWTVRDRWRDRMYYGWSWISTTIITLATIQKLDYEWITLPKQLHGLYYPLRFVRLFWQYVITRSAFQRIFEKSR